MYWHMAAYGEALGIAASNSDINAITDDVIQTRNSHLIVTEDMDLLAAHPMAASLTRARFGNVALTVRGANHLWPVTRSATVPAFPRPLDLRDYPLRLPRSEEITIEGSNDAAGADNTWVPLWLAHPNWRRTLPRGLDFFTTRATSVVAAGTEFAWGALTELVFERDLFGGVYSVVGAHMVAPNAVAFRLFFPRQPLINGRQFRPGGLVQNATGNMPWEAQNLGFGEWGRFHTFEPPSVQVLADAAGGTLEMRLTLIYLGSDEALLRQ